MRLEPLAALREFIERESTDEGTLFAHETAGLTEAADELERLRVELRKASMDHADMEAWGKENLALAERRGAEVERLRKELARSFLFAAEAKKKWAPDTTNSLVDEWLLQTHSALEKKG